jgi:hypothetical protein
MDDRSDRRQRRLAGYWQTVSKGATQMTMPNNTESRGTRADASGQPSSSAREQIREVKDQVVDQAKNTFQQARERASSSLGESKGQFAEQVGTIAEALRRTTQHLRSEDQQRIAGFTETLARQVDQVASYLRNKDARAMRQDLENLARRQPAVMLGGALVLGLIGARFLKSSERNRGSRRLGDGRNYGRERGYDPTGYSQSFSGETETERHLGAGARSGGGYAGS